MITDRHILSGSFVGGGNKFTGMNSVDDFIAHKKVQTEHDNIIIYAYYYIWNLSRDVTSEIETGIFTADQVEVTDGRVGRADVSVT